MFTFIFSKLFNFHIDLNYNGNDNNTTILQNCIKQKNFEHYFKIILLTFIIFHTYII